MEEREIGERYASEDKQRRPEAGPPPDMFFRIKNNLFQKTPELVKWETSHQYVKPRLAIGICDDEIDDEKNGESGEYQGERNALSYERKQERAQGERQKRHRPKSDKTIEDHRGKRRGTGPGALGEPETAIGVAAERRWQEIIDERTSEIREKSFFQPSASARFRLA